MKPRVQKNVISKHTRIMHAEKYLHCFSNPKFQKYNVV